MNEPNRDADTPRELRAIRPPNVPHSVGPAARAWHYATPLVLDALAMICTTVLVALGHLPVDSFKYLVGVLVVGNFALRTSGRGPGGGSGGSPSGGGFLFAFFTAAAWNIAKGWRS